MSEGIHIRVLDHAEDAASAARVLEEVWHVGPGDQSPAEPGLLVALAHAGNYVAGAFDGDRLVGVAVGFFSQPLGEGLHSHITGIAPSHAGRGIGRALKEHQRRWCLERGLATVTWTYDPLIARNGYFNFSRLGVESTEYLPNFYGAMRDGINSGQASDRLLVTWRLADPQRPDLEATPWAPLVPVLESRDGEPEVGQVPHDLPPGAFASVRVPSDIDSLRMRDPAGANRWRFAVREAFLGLMGAGFSVRACRRDGLYLFS